MVPDDEFSESALDLVRRLAAGPPQSYAAIKEALRYSASHGLAGALDKEAELQPRLGRTADHRAATTAFVRKERPVFQGR